MLLYHVTAAAPNAIRAHGIDWRRFWRPAQGMPPELFYVDGNYPLANYFWDSIEDAFAWLDLHAEDGWRHYVWQLESDGLDLQPDPWFDDNDEPDFQGHAWYVVEPVPADRLQLLPKRVWAAEYNMRAAA